MFGKLYFLLMKNDISIKEFGETELIQLIEERVWEKSGKRPIRDDSFFYDIHNIQLNAHLVLNSDMFVSTTDAPTQMNYYQMGRKSVIMNVSDLIVKGIKPIAIIISLGLPGDLILSDFNDIIEGIIDYCIKFEGSK